jgi:phosphomannomutase
MTSETLFERVEAFLARELDSSDRAELAELLAQARQGDRSAIEELSERFSGPLRFGTAGIRGVLGAGESRMNRSLVLRVTHGLVGHVLESGSAARERGVVIARDGRRLSEVFQKDAAAAAAALGVAVRFVPGASPTPLLAFAVRHLRASAGIMITASHNPPRYNGYKVYGENGAQIVPPFDEAVSARIDAAPERIPRAEGSALVREVSHLREEYLEAVSSLASVSSIEPGDLRIAYSALHGCGQDIFLEAMRRRGFSRVFPVPEQGDPDPDFPTVRFPNPEEPGALDLVLALARERDCGLVLVHDPDADRLGAAVRRAPGDYVVLDGNEIGVLLGHHVLSHTKEKRPLVVSTVVSSRMLSKMAEASGARYLDTFTGFKWIANDAMRVEAEEGVRFVFGYEEALGYTVGRVVRDKDGIGAGLVLAEMAAGLAAEGRTLLDALDELRRRHGTFRSRGKGVSLEGAAGAERIRRAMARLRSDPPARIAEESVSGVRDLAEGDVLLYDLEDGGRVAVRPSGTEPKLKLYLEVVEPSPERAARRLEALELGLLRLAGLA